MNDLMTKSFTSYLDLKETMRDLEAGPVPDVELGNAVDESLGVFLDEAESVKQEMESIREVLARLYESNEEIKSLHKPGSLKLTRTKINSDIITVLRKAKTIKSQLGTMDRSNAASKEGTAVYRTRLAVTAGLRKKLKELMVEFQALREKMVNEQKESAGRRYYTVTGEFPDEETIERIVSGSGGGDEMFRRAMEEQGRGKVYEAVMEIQDRHDAVKEIEGSLLELHQVFLDMAVMVEAQGEQLDDIEHHVMNAGNFVHDGANDLKSAKELQRSSRKWMCVGLLVLLIIFLLIFVPVVTSF